MREWPEEQADVWLHMSCAASSFEMLWPARYTHHFPFDLCPSLSPACLGLLSTISIGVLVSGAIVASPRSCDTRSVSRGSNPG